MERSIDVVREAVRTDRVSYGITTGFGAFANQRISADQIRQLQLNLVRSPCVRHRRAARCASCVACCC